MRSCKLFTFGSQLADVRAWDGEVCQSWQALLRGWGTPQRTNNKTGPRWTGSSLLVHSLLFSQNNLNVVQNAPVIPANLHRGVTCFSRSGTTAKHSWGCPSSSLLLSSAILPQWKWASTNYVQNASKIGTNLRRHHS